MSSLVERVLIQIQDSNYTAARNAFAPRRLGLYPPTTMMIVEAAEKTLGFSLPPLLRDLYTQVANGGFGPGYGIFGLDGGYADPQIFDPSSLSQTQGGTLTEWYFTYRGKDNQLPELNFEFNTKDKSTLLIDPEPKPQTWNWFDKLLPISNHGDWQVSCIDCSKSMFPVLFFDGQQCQLQPKNLTFNEWIEDWLNST